MASETDFDHHIKNIRFSPQKSEGTSEGLQAGDPQAGDPQAGDVHNEKRLPHSIEIEQELIGAILKDNRLLDDITSQLRPDHFYHPLHQLIFDTAIRLIQGGTFARAETMRHVLAGNPLFDDEKDARYLQELVVNVVTDMNATFHALTLLDLAKKRILLKEMSEASHTIYNEPEKNSEHHILSLETLTYNLSENNVGSSQPEEFNFFASKAMNTAKNVLDGTAIAGITSGFKNIDNYTGGFHRSDLIILAARPAMGKTALACNIAVNAAKKYLEKYQEQIQSPQTQKPQDIKKNTVLIFSLEMSGEQLSNRILCEQASVDAERIRLNRISSQEFKLLSEKQNTLQHIPLFIDHSPDLSLNHIRQRARKIKRQHNLSLIIIDYLQLLQGSHSSQKYQNRVMEITEISRGLKNLAKEFDIPIIALSQLNRKAEERDNPFPQLSDLRDSGSIEQDADVVFFLYREIYDHNKRKPVKKDNENENNFKKRQQNHEEKGNQIKKNATLYVAKNRHGKIGIASLGFDDQFARFYDSFPDDPNAPS